MMKSFSQKQLIANDQLITYYERDPKSDSRQDGGGKKQPPTLVFLHGWRQDSSSWEPVLPYFKEEKHRMIFIDLPGFGASELSKGVFSLTDYAETVHEVLGKLSVENVVLIGHSFGGRVGIKCAATYPEDIEKLVLIDSGGIRDTRSLGWKKAVAKVLKPIFMIPVLKGARKKIYKRMGAGDYVATPELKETFVNIIEEDLNPLLPRIEHETLIIWGENDSETPLWQGRRMSEKIPHSKLTVFEEAGHYSFQDKPERFAREIVSFISK